MSKKPMANIPPFGLRMQPDLKAKVEAASEASGRSMNGEIVARLEQSFVAWPTVTLHPAIIDRASRYPEEIRMAFEVGLSGYAERLSEQYFPNEASAVFELGHAYHAFIAAIPEERREKLSKALEKLIRLAISEFPADHREQLMKDYTQLFSGEGE